jgi:hypothetical protein
MIYSWPNLSQPNRNPRGVPEKKDGDTMTMRLTQHSDNHEICFRVFFWIILPLCLSGPATAHADLLPFLDDFNLENGGAGTIIDYQGFANWDVTSGTVDLKIDGHGSPPFQIFGDGMFVDTVGVGFAGEVTSKVSFSFIPGLIYSLKFDMSGNQRASSSDLVIVSVGNGAIFQEAVSLGWNAPWQTFERQFTVNAATNGTVRFSGTGSVVNQGMLLDNIELQTTPDPSTPVSVRLDDAVYYPIASDTNMTYQLFGRISPFTNDWFAVDGVHIGTGDILYGFERGFGAVFLPSRAWEIKVRTDEVGLLFDGVDDFAFRAHDPLLDLTGGMTLEAWVKPEDPSTGTGGTVLAKAASLAIMTYRIGMNESDHAMFQVFDAGGTAFADLSSSGQLPPGAWTHVAATYDGSMARIFLNGLPDVLAATTGVVRTSSLAPLVAGSILGSDPFGGIIDEVRLWDHARTPAEIFSTYNSKLNGNESGLVSYWQLREPGSQTAEDSTANGFDLGLGDSGGTDTVDPTWVGESFPGPASFENILEFGLPWFTVYWATQTDSTYTLESVVNISSGSWSSVIENIQGIGGDYEYFETPLIGDPGFPDTRYYRVLGPPVSNVTQGLIGHFPLNVNANDASGNGHHGTPQGGVTFINDPDRGQVASFNGVDSVIDHGDVDDFEVLDRSMSFSAWIKTAFDGANGMHVLTMLKTQADFGGYRLLIRDTCSLGALDFSVNYDLGSGDQLAVAAAQRINDGSWHHLCAVVDRGAETVHLYIDGVDDIGETGCSWLPETNSTGYDSADSGTTPFLIGNQHQASSYWNGLIDEVRIYNRALSVEEVQVLLNL